MMQLVFFEKWDCRTKEGTSTSSRQTIKTLDTFIAAFYSKNKLQFIHIIGYEASLYTRSLLKQDTSLENHVIINHKFYFHTQNILKVLKLKL